MECVLNIKYPNCLGCPESPESHKDFCTGSVDYSKSLKN